MHPQPLPQPHPQHHQYLMPITERPAEVFVRGEGAWLWDEFFLLNSLPSSYQERPISEPPRTCPSLLKIQFQPYH